MIYLVDIALAHLFAIFRKLRDFFYCIKRFLDILRSFMGYSKMKLEIFRNVFMEKFRKVSWDFYSWVSQTLGPGAEEDHVITCQDLNW